MAIEIPSEGILDAPAGSSSRAPDARRPRCAPASRRRRADECARWDAVIHEGRFEGKVAVVTGAAQGIGEAVATGLAREGGKVALVDRSELVQ